MVTTKNRVVDDYLDRLDKELRGLPRARRRELVEQIREHIEEERSQYDIESEAELRNMLDRLGEPADIAAEARYRFGVRPAKGGWRETATLILLPIGGIVIPFLGWVIGVVLLWASDVWSTRQKLIGTLVPPGGFMATFFVLVVVAQATVSTTKCTSDLDPATGKVLSSACPGGGGISTGHILLIALLAVMVIAPIATTAYLATHMRRGRQAADLALDVG